MSAARLVLAISASLGLLLGASAAGAAPANQYSAMIAPAAVKPTTAATFTIALTNRPSSPGTANNGHVGVPSDFVVDAGTLGATTTKAGSCNASAWTATLDASVINVVAPPGGASALCPGGTLRITFSARAPAAERAYTWATSLFHDSTAFSRQGSQPAVSVDGTPPPTPTISSGPANPSNSSSASFSFADGDATAVLSCSLDGQPFAGCTSPKSYAGLGGGAHSFVVKAVDPAGNESAVTSPYAWTVDLTPPPPPTLKSKPPTVTTATSATFEYTDDDATVQYFCRLDGAAFAACTSPRAYTGLASGAHAFDVKARDPAGNESAPTSYSWTIDLTRPVVTIDPATEPHDPTTATDASFAFVSNKAGSTFTCDLDGSGFTACRSPTSYSSLAEGTHRFSVEATDSLGTSGLPTVWQWTVDKTPPTAPAVDSAPASPTNSSVATIAFHGAETGLAFACSIDGGAFAPCTSPVSFSGLADGTHHFAVRATDAAGNVGPATGREWVVDTQPPSTTITSAPPSVSSSTTASFAFAGNEPSSFACSLDGASFSPCSSPKRYDGLANGSHTFRVQAMDLAGNAETRPPAFSWQILTLQPPDRTPPSLVHRLRTSVQYGFLRLSWEPPGDPDLDHILVQRARSPGGAQTTVYDGRGKDYVDRHFDNGSYFVYGIRSYDRAGNGSSPRRVVVSPSALLRSPRDGAVIRAWKALLLWARVPKAAYYNVQLYRGSQKVLSAWPSAPRRALVGRWSYQARVFALSKGVYRWYVWPGFGARTRAVYGHLLGTAIFVVR